MVFVGLTALHYAALRGNETTIDMLCLHEAHVTEPCLYDGNTALHLAAQHGHYSAVSTSLLFTSDGCKPEGRGGEGVRGMHPTGRQQFSGP